MVLKASKFNGGSAMPAMPAMPVRPNLLIDTWENYAEKTQNTISEIRGRQPQPG